jgi:hypothetical protein
LLIQKGFLFVSFDSPTNLKDSLKFNETNINLSELTNPDKLWEESPRILYFLFKHFKNSADHLNIEGLIFNILDRKLRIDSLLAKTILSYLSKNAVLSLNINHIQHIESQILLQADIDRVC